MFKEIVKEVTISLIKENQEKSDKERLRRGLFHLDEMNINRLKMHGENGFIIISSNKDRIIYSNPEISLEPEYLEYLKNNPDIEDSEDVKEEWLKNRNRNAEKEIRNFAKTSKYSYSLVYGGYKDMENGKSFYEPSIIIYNKDKQGNPLDFNELYQLALELCKKYKQESVYINRPGESPIYIDMHGNKVNSTEGPNIKINREDQEYFTTTKRDKTNPQKFTSDIQFENIYREQGIDFTERIRRIQNGEYII